MVNEDLIAAWGVAYRGYEEAKETEVASTSRAVAAAWRDLAANTELPWWLLAAVHSAAESFDFQADAWEAAASRGVTTPLAEGDDTVGPAERLRTWPTVALPTARRPTNGCQVHAEVMPSGDDHGDDRTEPGGDD